MITQYLINSTERQLAVLLIIRSAIEKANQCKREIDFLYRLDGIHPYRANIAIQQQQEATHRAAALRLQNYYFNLVHRMMTAIDEKEIGYPVNVRIAEMVA